MEKSKFSKIEPNALRFCFDVVLKDSLAENAELIISKLNGLGICQQSQQQIGIQTLYDTCVYCGNPYVKVIQGA